MWWIIIEEVSDRREMMWMDSSRVEAGKFFFQQRAFLARGDCNSAVALLIAGSWRDPTRTRRERRGCRRCRRQKKGTRTKGFEKIKERKGRKNTFIK